MGFSVGTLANYTKENEALLVASSVLGSKTASLIKDRGNVMVGVKSAETINIMDTDAIFQDGSSCGFTASGTTSFTQRTVTVGKIKVNEALCLKDLEAKYLQKALPAGSMYDSMVYSEEYSKRKAEKIAEQLEKTLWQGSTASVDVNLNKFQGITTLITAAGGSVVNANTVANHGVVETAITDANVVSIFDDIYKAIPAQVVDKDDMAIFCGMDVFRTYTVKLKTSNLYHYQYDGKANGEFYLPGTNVKVTKQLNHVDQKIKKFQYIEDKENKNKKNRVKNAVFIFLLFLLQIFLIHLLVRCNLNLLVVKILERLLFL